MQEKKISAALATYNRVKYIKEQMESILYQISDGDEIVVSDDGLTDDTLEILYNISRENSRIRVINGQQDGIFRNFENAMMNCKNEIIFLSDQDVIWIEKK